MRKSALAFIIITVFILMGFREDKPAYRIFKNNGKSSGYRNC